MSNGWRVTLNGRELEEGSDFTLVEDHGHIHVNLTNKCLASREVKVTIHPGEKLAELEAPQDILQAWRQAMSGDGDAVDD